MVVSYLTHEPNSPNIVSFTGKGSSPKTGHSFHIMFGISHSKVFVSYALLIVSFGNDDFMRETNSYRNRYNGTGSMPKSGVYYLDTEYSGSIPDFCK